MPRARMGQTCWRTAKSKSGLDSKIQFNGVGELRTLILAPRGRLRFLSSLTLVLAGKRAFGMLASDGRAPVQCAYAKSPLPLLSFPPEGGLFDCDFSVSERLSRSSNVPRRNSPPDGSGEERSAADIPERYNLQAVTEVACEFIAV